MFPSPRHWRTQKSNRPKPFPEWIKWQWWHQPNRNVSWYCIPTGADGLPLVPVPVQDCPPGSVSLPSCDQASPGELCEGDGQCGTRRAWCWGFGDNNNRKQKLLGGSHNVLIVTSLTSLTGKLMRRIYWQHFSDEWNPWNYQLIPHIC